MSENNKEVHTMEQKLQEQIRKLNDRCDNLQGQINDNSDRITKE
jgi:peptidoglycan hydrolase CwlO-like protein